VVDSQKETNHEVDQQQKQIVQPPKPSVQDASPYGTIASIGGQISAPELDSRAGGGLTGASTIAAGDSIVPPAQTGQQQQQPAAVPPRTNSYAEGLAGLQPVVYPGRSEAQQQQALAATFNGLGRCAVFPVPVTSIAVSIWSPILKSSSSSLEINPYGKLLLPVSELLDLTLPPVDAMSMSPWPKPLAYYRQGASADGATHTLAGRHVHHHVTESMQQQQQAVNPSGISSSQIHQQHQIEIQQRLMQERAESYAAHLQQLQIQNGVPAGAGGLTAQQILMLQKQRQLEHQHHQQQIQQHQQQQQQQTIAQHGSDANVAYAMQQQMMQQQQAEQAAQQQKQLDESQSAAAAAAQNKSAGGGGGGIPSISILQQMFPSVKMSYGAPNQKR
jgi:hypothetical protein